MIAEISKRDVNFIEKANHTSKPIINMIAIFQLSSLSSCNFLPVIIDKKLFSLWIFIIYLNNKYNQIMLIKNNQASNFISLACWKTIIGIEINIVQTNIGIFIKVFFVLSVFNKSLVINTIEIKLKNHQITFKKKAWVVEPNIYQIQVNVCQAYIHHREIISQAWASKCG